MVLNTIVLGQKISQQVIGSSGNYISSLGYSLNYTVGETVTTTSSNLGFVLGQGFHHYGLIATSIDDIELLNNFILFPNPATTDINFKRLSENENKIYIINIFDTKGRLVLAFNMKPEDSVVSFNIANLECGFYIMHISDSSSIHTNYKFIKI